MDIDRNLNWKNQVCKVRRSCLSSLAKLSRVSSFLPFETKKRLYDALVLPHMDYCCVVWMEYWATLRHKIERLKNYGMRLITSSPQLACSATLRSRLGWVPMEQRRRLFRLALVHYVSSVELHSICAPNLLPMRASASILPQPPPKETIH